MKDITKMACAVLIGSLVLQPPASMAAEDEYVDMYKGLLKSATPEGEPLLVFGEHVEGTGQVITSSTVFTLKGFASPFIAKYLYVAPPGVMARDLRARPPGQLRDAASAVTVEGAKLIWSTVMVADEVLLGLKEETTQDLFKKRLGANAAFGAVRALGKRHLAIKVKSGSLADLEARVKTLEEMTDTVECASPDYVGLTFVTPPNDPKFTTSVTDMTRQWYLPRINVLGGWDVKKEATPDAVGNMNVMAVLDTGIDFTNPDLAPNKFVNVLEDGMDTDGSGKTGDVSGWNFVDGNANPIDTSTDGHGTHVAGIIGAKADNAMGISGMVWTGKLLALRIASTSAAGFNVISYSKAIEASQYIIALNGVPDVHVTVANHSWGGTGWSKPLFDAINLSNYPSEGVTYPTANVVKGTWTLGSAKVTITGTGLAGATEISRVKAGMTVKNDFGNTWVVLQVGNVSGNTATMLISAPATGTQSLKDLRFSLAAAPGNPRVLHVAAAGNSRLDLDHKPIFPACLPSPYVVSVGASDRNDVVLDWTLATQSNVGPLSLDLFAPGDTILSTLRLLNPGTERYGFLTGTSVAAPVVTGAAALMRLQNPTWGPDVIRRALMTGVEYPSGPPPLPNPASVVGKCFSNGRLSLDALLHITTPPPPFLPLDFLP